MGWGGRSMCCETSGEAASVPPQVPPTCSPQPNSYRTCSTPTSESPLGCPLRTLSPQTSEAEADGEGGRKKSQEKSKGSRTKKPFLNIYSIKGFLLAPLLFFKHSALFYVTSPSSSPCPSGMDPPILPHCMDCSIRLLKNKQKKKI